MRRCVICNGAGIVTGLGMMKKDCKVCQGTGAMPDLKLDKESKTYKDSINKIKKKYKDLSVEAIESMIEQEFQRV